jgi:hypothetical protein
VQPGATPFFCVRGATRLTDISTPDKGSFLVRICLKNDAYAPKRSKKAALSEKCTGRCNLQMKNGCTRFVLLHSIRRLGATAIAVVAHEIKTNARAHAWAIL